MYLAPIVAVFVCLIHCLIFVQSNLEKALGWKIPWFLHAYWLQFGLLGSLLLYQGYDSWHKAILSTAWLDPAVMTSLVECHMLKQNECFQPPQNISAGECPPEVHGDLGCNSSTFLTWQQEVIMSTPFLTSATRWLSLTCPLWVFGSFLVGFSHIYQHSIAMKGEKVWENPTRRMIIVIVLLPLIWVSMSFCSVMRCWQIILNHVPTERCGGPGDATDAPDPILFGGFLERRDFLLQMYDANFSVASVYDAFAMFAFTEIVTSIVKVKTTATLLASSNAAPASKRHHWAMGAAVSPAEGYHAVVELTVEGVLLFVLQSLAKSFYTLFITTMAFNFCGSDSRLFSIDARNPGLFQQSHVRKTMDAFFLGVSVVASHNAMRHIGTLQKKKHLLSGHCDNPDLKCTMIKILTSLQSVQPVAFYLLSEFLHVQFGTEKLGQVWKELLMASLLCMECFFIALGHLRAWPADELWIDNFPDDIREEILTELNDPLAALDKDCKLWMFGKCGCVQRANQLRRRSQRLWQAEPEAPLSPASSEGSTP